MKLFLRILLFVLCINSGVLSYSANANSSATSAAPLQSPETLEKIYVKLEASTNSSLNISILRTLSTLTRYIQAKSYSLLNWKTYQRADRNLQIANYERKNQFGRWVNDPNDDVCYNTRAKVLLRDSDKAVIFRDNNHCVIDSGEWKDPYTGTTYTSAQDVQIDHFVPLKNAYKSGANNWSYKARCLYANYMGYDYHLMTVDGPENMKKGDKGPNRYMPPNPEYTCTYLKNWLTIKFFWGLNMTQGEAEAIAKELRDNNCNLAKFTVTSREILQQAQFFKENIDMCREVISDSQPQTQVKAD